MTKLTERLAGLYPHLYQRDVERIVAAIFDEISRALSHGRRVELRGFGAFTVKRREARAARNPRTGVSVRVPGEAHSILQERQGTARTAQPSILIGGQRQEIGYCSWLRHATWRLSKVGSSLRKPDATRGKRASAFSCVSWRFGCPSAAHAEKQRWGRARRFDREPASHERRTLSRRATERALPR